MIAKNPGLFKFWADSQFPSNLPSFPFELPSFPLSLYWANSVFTVISYALASHSRTLSIHRSPHNMSFAGAVDPAFSWFSPSPPLNGLFAFVFLVLPVLI